MEMRFEFMLLVNSIRSLISDIRINRDYAASTLKIDSQYRSNSHAGFPKGSYTMPNPVHYHLARCYETAQPMRPTLVKLGYHDTTNRYKSSQEKSKPTVTISIGNTKTITLDIPIQTLKEFIYPFANALNLTKAQESCSTGSQTSFVSTSLANSSTNSSLLTITELSYKNNTLAPRRLSDQSELSDYESKIIQNLHEKLLGESTNLEPEIDLESYEQVNNENLNTSNLDVKNWAKNVMEKTKYFDKSLSVLEDVIQEALVVTKEFATNTEELLESASNESWSSCVSCKNDAISPDEERHILDNKNCVDINKNVVDRSRVIVDEGVNASSLNTVDWELPGINDEKVVRMSDAIYDYLITNGFELKELVLFPEIIYDEHVIKLYAQLQMYYNLFNDNLSDEAKNILRLNIANQVIQKFEIQEQLSSGDTTNNPSDSPQIVSDKIFTISEIVSDILDNFFTKYVENNEPQNRFSDSTAFSQFSEDVQVCQTVQQSTPQHNNVKHSHTPVTDVVNAGNDHEIVISFKAKETKSLGNEKYWIAITKSPDTNQKVVKKCEIINVDDIPLKPPPDLDVYNTPANESLPLSPIPEEVQCNLYEKFVSLENEEESVDYNLDNITEIKQCQNVSNLLSNKKESTYIAFDRPETTVVVCNSADFYRSNTVNAFSYTQASNVDFIRNYKRIPSPVLYDQVSSPPKLQSTTDLSYDYDEIQYSDGEGDWMGYEGAKF